MGSSACGHTEPRTGDPATCQRTLALGKGPRRQWKKANTKPRNHETTKNKQPQSPPENAEESIHGRARANRARPSRSAGFAGRRVEPIGETIRSFVVVSWFRGCIFVDVIAASERTACKGRD